MYRHKRYQVRPIFELRAEIQRVSEAVAEGRLLPVKRIFVADGDALGMPLDHWKQLLDCISESFPRISRVSCYGTARNLLEKSVEDLRALRERGLRLLYIGPESGDDATLKAIAKGANFADHVEAARRANEAGLHQSLMFLLGVAGRDDSDRHAAGAAQLTTEMDPRYVSLLTLTVVPDTPLFQLQKRKRFELPSLNRLMQEIRKFVETAAPTNAVFRSNHASNYLPLAGRLPRDRARLLGEIDAALAGEVALRPEWRRRL